jgi:hypothetical protein
MPMPMPMPMYRESMSQEERLANYAQVKADAVIQRIIDECGYDDVPDDVREVVRQALINDLIVQAIARQAFSN